MIRAHFVAAALALAVALPRPLASAPDRYQGEPQANPSPAEATDPGRGRNQRTAATGYGDRQKRAYAAWMDYEGFSRWKPTVYQLTRPYFIPVYGAPGRVPIYFPPQKLNLNPGAPADNPVLKRPYRGPGYLPPTTEKPTTMKVVNRFIDDDDDDDRPVWGGSNQVGQPSKNKESGGIIPTRPPRPTGMPDFPPLVHDVNGGGTNVLAAESAAEQSGSPSRTTTPRPIVSGPSNCVWAIVSCCSASSARVPDSCFEQRGCPGPFWGSSPCDSDYAKAAIASALNYYGD